MANRSKPVSSPSLVFKASLFAHNISVLQLDMTAFVKPGTEERIGIIQDYVDPELTSFLEKLAKEHADIPVVQTNCGSFSAAVACTKQKG